MKINSSYADHQGPFFQRSAAIAAAELQAMPAAERQMLGTRAALKVEAIVRSLPLKLNSRVFSTYNVGFAFDDGPERILPDEVPGTLLPGAGTGTLDLAIACDLLFAPAEALAEVVTLLLVHAYLDSLGAVYDESVIPADFRRNIPADVPLAPELATVLVMERIGRPIANAVLFWRICVTQAGTTGCAERVQYLWSGSLGAALRAVSPGDCCRRRGVLIESVVANWADLTEAHEL